MAKRFCEDIGPFGAQVESVVAPFLEVGVPTGGCRGFAVKFCQCCLRNGHSCILDMSDFVGYILPDTGDRRWASRSEGNPEVLDQSLRTPPREKR